MLLTFAPKESDKAYVANQLWLPKAGIRVEPLKRALEFLVSGPNGQQTELRLWGESEFHLICPREFIPTQDYQKYKFPFVDLRPRFQTVQFGDCIKPWNEEQEKAWGALSQNDNGIFNLACGKGKTVLALKKIAQRRTPALVIVPDGGILSQWEETILGSADKSRPPGIMFDGELGRVQGPTFNWAHPITLALVTTLWMKIEEGSIPEEMFRYFGLVVYDEVHRIGAPKFSLTAKSFYGDRIGLTATVLREDGLDPVYRYHIGEPFYSDMSQDLVPRIYFLKTPAKIDFEKAKLNENINISLLRTMLGRDWVGNVYRYWSIKEALENGRKVLCLSHSLDQLRLFHAIFPESSLIIGETKKDKRMKALRDSQICFAISKLGSEGVDDNRLDTLFWLTPFRSRVSLQQSMGRVQRAHLNKKTPVVGIFEDSETPPLKKLCLSLKHQLKEWGYKFEVPSVQPHPRDLPSDLKAIYEETLSSLA